MKTLQVAASRQLALPSSTTGSFKTGLAMLMLSTPSIFWWLIHASPGSTSPLDLCSSTGTTMMSTLVRACLPSPPVTSKISVPNWELACSNRSTCSATTMQTTVTLDNTLTAVEAYIVRSSQHFTKQP